MYVEGASALNRVRWSHSGKEIATGDSEGQVQVYDVGEVRCHPVCVAYLFTIDPNDPHCWSFLSSPLSSCSTAS